MADHIGDGEVFDDFVDDVGGYVESLWLTYQGRKLTFEEMDHLHDWIRGFFNEKRFEEEEE